MIVWLCDKCGCELKQEDKPKQCPLCTKRDVEFIQFERKDPNKEDLEINKRYEEVIEKLEEYTEECEPEKAKFSLED